MSEELQATLERIAEQQEANTAAIAALAERQANIAEQQEANSAAIAGLAERQSELATRQADFDTRIARLLQITERYVTQTDANTARLDNIAPNS